MGVSDSHPHLSGHARFLLLLTKLTYLFCIAQLSGLTLEDIWLQKKRDKKREEEVKEEEGRGRG